MNFFPLREFALAVESYSAAQAGPGLEMLLCQLHECGISGLCLQAWFQFRSRIFFQKNTHKFQEFGCKYI